jgi:methylated-DNA-protein-cysteine methyltransferase-like protein
MPSDSYERIYTIVSLIPKGKVATYGQVAQLAGLPRQARLAGYALNVLPKGSRIPWHRVINAQGKISLRSEGEGSDNRQVRALKREKVRFNQQGVVDLKLFRWEP